eukprot:297841-Rhodomonas_salina.10
MEWGIGIERYRTWGVGNRRRGGKSGREIALYAEGKCVGRYRTGRRDSRRREVGDGYAATWVGDSLVCG